LIVLPCDRWRFGADRRSHTRRGARWAVFLDRDLVLERHALRREFLMVADEALYRTKAARTGTLAG